MVERQAFRDLPQGEQQKRVYFGNLSRQTFNELKLHSQVGLWERVDGKRDWGNVSEHCLVEVARINVLGRALGLPEDVQKDLTKAAALHDFFKKGEKEIVVARGLSWEAMEEAEAESEKRLQEAGFSERVVRLAGAVGHNSLQETQRILAQDTFSADDTAFLVMHYVDDYTVNSDWVQPTEVQPDGRGINNLDRRMDKNEANSRYAILNEAGRQHFNGETSFQAQRRIGHMVEGRLADLLTQQTGQSVEPLRLPEFVDDGIKAAIATTEVKPTTR